jgi:uncharacterized membrane-anchored protein
MNLERTWTAGPTNAFGLSARALNPSPMFWLAMFVASAFGTVLGDFWAEGLHLGLVLSFGTLVVITGLLIWGDFLKGQQTEAFYWLAIIFLRAGAPNVGDGLIHIFGLSFIFASLLTGVATLVAGFFALPPFAGATSPLIDLRYWLAMGLGGVFGTVFGDLSAHTLGMFPALITLGVGLIVVILVRGALAPISMLGYWCIVLAERAAGTPAGDWFASRRGLGLGLSAALLCVGAGLIAALWLYQRTKRQEAGLSDACLRALVKSEAPHVGS